MNFDCKRKEIFGMIIIEGMYIVIYFLTLFFQMITEVEFL